MTAPVSVRAGAAGAEGAEDGAAASTPTGRGRISMTDTSLTAGIVHLVSELSCTADGRGGGQGGWCAWM